jgi:formylglycine-generating enzyme required for sulfatase activity
MRVVFFAIAVATTGCFPDYSVGKNGTGGSGGGGGTAGMNLIQANGAEFKWQVDSWGQQPIDFSVNFDYDFEIDQNEVTVARFRAWEENAAGAYPVPCDNCSLDDGGPYQSAMQWHQEWDTAAKTAVFQKGAGFCEGDLNNIGDYGEETTYEMGDDEYPMTCVTWQQAVAFCAFEDKRLPTEVEWLYVASSKGKRLDYPWGSTWESCDDATINYDATSTLANECEFPVDIGTASNDETEDGVEDMGGSVFEWVWDATWTNVGEDWPQGSTRYAGPDFPTTSSGHLRNGGAYLSKPGDARGRNDQFESDFADYQLFYDHGFRCARSVK